MLSDKVPDKGLHIPQQVKPPPRLWPWKSICATAGVILLGIPATNIEIQEFIGLPPSLTVLIGLLGGGFLGAAIGEAMEKSREHRIFLERHPELKEKRR
jgi:hypothetical protein